MTWIGTDTLALACILASATASGAATVALRGGPEHVEHHCVVEATASSPNIVISGIGSSSRVVTGVMAPSVVVTRGASAHHEGDCSVVIQKQQHRHRIHVQDLEHLQELDLHLGDLDARLQEMDVELREMDFDFDFDFNFEEIGDAVGADVEAEVQARIEAELEKVRAKLEGKGLL